MAIGALNLPARLQLIDVCDWRIEFASAFAIVTSQGRTVRSREWLRRAVAGSNGLRSISHRRPAVDSQEDSRAAPKVFFPSHVDGILGTLRTDTEFLENHSRISVVLTLAAPDPQLTGAPL